MLDRFAALRAGEAGPDLGALRDELTRDLTASTPFAVVAGNANLSVDDAAVLAVLAVAELDPAQHHRIAELQGDLARRRVTIGSLVEIFRDVAGHPGALCVAADAPLRTAALVDVVADGPWSDHVIALHPSVLWALIGDTARDPAVPHPVETRTAATADGDALTVVAGDDRVRRIDAAVAATAGRTFLVAPRGGRRWSAKRPSPVRAS